MTHTYQEVSERQALEGMLAKAARADRDQKNRRGEERYPFSSRVTLGTLGANGDLHPVAEVCTVDVSASGLGLLSKLALPTGKTFWLEMESGTPGAWRVRARVIYCRPLFADVYRVGVEFIPE